MTDQQLKRNWFDEQVEQAKKAIELWPEEKRKRLRDEAQRT